MATGDRLMGGWFGFEEDAKRERADAWIAAWSAMQRSTAPVDRNRAEHAMAALYAERGLPQPGFVWADCPTDGLTAWDLLSRGRDPLINPWTRGDWGTGANVRLYRLHDPFGLEPAWQYRALHRAAEYAPSGFPAGGEYGVNGAAVSSAMDSRRAATWRAGTHADTAPQASPPLEEADPHLDEVLARRALGPRFELLAALVGQELLVEVTVRTALRAAVELQTVHSSRREAVQALTLPQFDRVVIAMGALADVMGVSLWRQLEERAERSAMVERRLELARCGAGFWAFEDLVVMLERPSHIGSDERGRLHAEDGPALAWPDGLAVWADHGVEVPGHVITDPDRISVRQIDEQANAEVRRVMVERFGAERLIREGGAKLVDEDETGRLWHREHAHAGWREEALAMVEVRNSTPEPDGTVRTYFLRVPPTIRVAREAVGWTFGLDGGRYAPVVET